jgi:chromosome segregation ATPase
MSDLHEDLRSTEDSIRHDADRLKNLEDEKAATDPADPRITELSEQAERLAASLHDTATAERELSEQIQAAD